MTDLYANVTETSLYVIALVVYILPLTVAFVRDHRHWRAIGFLTIALGWTVVFWIFCMAWALMGQKEVKPNGKNDC